MKIEWAPLDVKEWDLDCLPGAIEVQGLKDACVQVYRDGDPELVDPARPFHWYVSTWGTRSEYNNAGLCATEDEAKAVSLKFADEIGLFPEGPPPKGYADDQTLDLFMATSELVEVPE